MEEKTLKELLREREVCSKMLRALESRTRALENDIARLDGQIREKGEMN